MKLGNIKIFIYVFALLLINTLPIFSVDKIESVPLINLEELSPTFEEDKEVLEKTEDQNTNLNNINSTSEEIKAQKNDKIFIFIRITFVPMRSLVSVDNFLFSPVYVIIFVSSDT